MGRYILETYKVGMQNINISKSGGRTANAEIYINYLHNGDHDNHIDRTEILNTIGDKKEFLIENGMRILKNVEHRKKVNRGRPLKVSNKSLTFNIPKSYEVTKEDSIAIQMDLLEMIRNLYASNGYRLSDIELYSVIHYQENKHINVIIPYLDKDGKILPFTKSRKRFFMKMAREFTKITDNRLGTNIKTYMTEQEQLAKADEIMDNLDDLSLSEIQELKIKHKDNKRLKLTLDYAYRIINSVDSNKQKHIDRLINTVEKVGNDKKLTKEEADDFSRALRNQKLLALITPEGKEKILKAMPDSSKANK